MEDRVWSYRQADNIDYDKVKILDEVCYVWNRMNNNNSVSLVRGTYWNASAWCHIGHQKQLLGELKHEEYRDLLKNRIKESNIFKPKETHEEVVKTYTQH